MKKLNRKSRILVLLTLIGGVSLFSHAYAGEVTYPEDSYSFGNTLTADDLNSKFNEIKAEVNDNNARIASIEQNRLVTPTSRPNVAGYLQISGIANPINFHSLHFGVSAPISSDTSSISAKPSFSEITLVIDYNANAANLAQLIFAGIPTATTDIFINNQAGGADQLLALAGVLVSGLSHSAAEAKTSTTSSATLTLAFEAIELTWAGSSAGYDRTTGNVTSGCSTGGLSYAVYDGVIDPSYAAHQKISSFQLGFSRAVYIGSGSANEISKVSASEQTFTTTIFDRAPCLMSEVLKPTPATVIVQIFNESKSIVAPEVEYESSISGYTGFSLSASRDGITLSFSFAYDIIYVKTNVLDATGNIVDTMQSGFNTITSTRL